MLRAIFEKKGNAVYISHLDLMRLFQRAFKRAGLLLTHTQGYNPRPSVSIALPLSVGVESCCELLDFDLEGEIPPHDEILARLNQSLVEGVKVLSVYECENKVKNIALLDCRITLEYDYGVPVNADAQIRELLSSESVIVDKKSKNGVTQQDIIPMILQFSVDRADAKSLEIDCRICCQNPTLNPAQIVQAIERYLPGLKPNFARYCRLEIYQMNQEVFR